MSFLDFLAPLLNDPSAAGGGFLSKLLGIGGAGADPTTGLTPPTAATAPYSPFTQQSGIMGNSPLVNLLRDGFVGMSGANGYTGLSAVGAGAKAATKYNQENQQFRQNTALGGQQYASGTQSLAEGNLALGQKLRNYNLWDKAYNPGAHVDLTYADLSDPAKLAKVMSFTGGAPQQSQGGTQTADASGGATPVAPQLDSTVNPAAPPSAVGAPLPVGPPSSPDSGPASAPAAGTAPDALTAEFTKMYGMPPTQYAILGRQMQDQSMVDKAAQYDPTLLTGIEAAKARGQRFVSKPGGALLSGETGGVIGSGNPIKTEILDPAGSGNMVPAIQYPDGRIELSGYASTPGTGGLPVGPPTSPGQPAPNNNPGNIRPPGASTGFRNYPDLASGINGVVGNLQAYGQKGINTVSKIVSTWAPPNENDTQAYIADVAKQTGIDPNAPLNMNDPKVLTRLALAITNHEQGAVAPQGGTAANNSSVTGTNGGASPVSKLGPYADETQTEWAKRRSELGEFADSGIQAEQRFTALADALKATQSGSFAAQKGQVAAALKAVGIDLDPSVLGDPAQLQIALKESTQGVFSQIKSLVGGRVAAQEINLLSTASANPNLQPAANAKIIAQAIGAIRYQRDYYQALSAQKNPVDPNDFEINFQKAHPLQGYVDAAEKDIGPLKGMEQPASGQKSTILPKITGDADYNKLPKGAHFLDPSGQERVKP